MENVNITQPGYYCYTARFSKMPELVRVGFFYVKVRHHKQKEAKSTVETTGEVTTRIKNGWKIVSGPYERRQLAVEKRFDLPEFKATFTNAPVA
jgi:hypothetical protein